MLIETLFGRKTIILAIIMVLSLGVFSFSPAILTAGDWHNGHDGGYDYDDDDQGHDEDKGHDDDDEDGADDEEEEGEDGDDNEEEEGDDCGYGSHNDDGDDDGDDGDEDEDDDDEGHEYHNDDDCDDDDGDDDSDDGGVITIIAHKIFCDDESLLPNWGTGGVLIDGDTAIDFVYENSEHCWFKPGWSFEWGNEDVTNPGDDFLGAAGNGWNTFGPTDTNGEVIVEIDEYNLDGTSFLWVREVLQEGFLSFSYGGENGSNSDDVSAEMYCNTDVLNYDNFDRIDYIEADETYYCVAFNTLEPEPEPLHACSDELDNDGDQLVDIDDPACHTDGDGGNPDSYDPDGDSENEKPVITLLPDNPINLTTGDTFTDPGATADDPEDGDITVDIVVGGDMVDVNTVGTYTVTYNVVDSQALSADEVTRTVIVTDPAVTTECSDGIDNDIDDLTDIEDPGCHTDGDPGNPSTYDPNDDDENTKPVIDLLGDNPLNLNVGDIFTDPGATAVDLEDGDITVDIVVGGETVDTNTPDTYTITYNVVDSEGLAADEVTRDVIVTSITEPAVCSDGADNDGDNLIDTADPGCHTDGDPDNTSSYDPNDEDEFDLVPYAPYCGDGEVNQVWEQCDLGEGCTSQCQFEENNQCTDLVLARVNTDNIANHGSGDASSDVFLGSVTNRIPGGIWFALHYLGSYFTDPDVSGYEDVPGLAVERRTTQEVRVLLHGSHGLNGSKEHIDGNVEFWNTTVSGQTNDESGNNKLENFNNLIKDNVPQEDEISLDINDDTKSFFYMTVATNDDAFFTQFAEAPICPLENQKPVITLLPDNPINLTTGGAFTDPGATALDPEDGDITADIVVGGDTVDVNTQGTYVITYNVVDSQALSADEVTRTVFVTDPSSDKECSDGVDNDSDQLVDSADPGCHTDGDPDNPSTYDPNDDSENQKPAITLIGDSPHNLNVADTFSDDGSTALDQEDGDITVDIVVGGDTVDINTSGTYVITYNVVDSEGLAADEVTRDVVILGSPPPPPPPPVCLNCGGGGGGGGPINPLIIFNETVSVVSPGTALITWETNKPANSQVAYDVNSQVITGSTINLGVGDDKLGYAFVTVETTGLTQTHSVLVTSVDLETLHYFRPISEDNTRAVGNELNALLDGPTGESCSLYLEEFIRFGANNNPEQVLKLQLFLNEFEGTDLELNGVYNEATFDAVVDFQNKYGGDVLTPWGLEEDTGYVYLTTRKKINEIYCKGQLLFPLTEAQQAEVDAFRALLQGLRDAGQPLPDTSGVGRDDTRDDIPVFVEEDTSDDDDELATEETDTEESDSLASAIEATGDDGTSATGRVIQRISDFFRGIFGR